MNVTTAMAVLLASQFWGKRLPEDKDQLHREAQQVVDAHVEQMLKLRAGEKQ